MPNKNLGPQIIELSKQGKNYDEIKVILNCSKGTICYHLGNGQKQKNDIRRKINRAKKHPYQGKIENFGNQRNRQPRKPPYYKWKKIIESKLRVFFKDRKTNMYNKPTFTVEDVINKFGENPKCYLTGEQLNIYEPRNYAFDHIIPVSRGGDNSLDNLGLCTREANQAKFNMTPDEFLFFCKKVVDNYKPN